MINIFYNTRLITFGTPSFGELEHFEPNLSEGWTISEFKVATVASQTMYHYTTVLLRRPKLWFKILTLGIAR